jgi:ABC-2 type transport system permease protein
MEAIFIALKDTYQSYKNWFLIMFAFGIPLLLGGFYYLVFGNVSDAQDNFNIPQTNIGIINLDEGDPLLDAAMGDLFYEVLTSEDMPPGLFVTEFASQAEARQALLEGDLTIALVIPASFSADLLNTETVTRLEVLSVPGENVTGVNIVKSITRQLATSLEAGFTSAMIVYEEALQHNLTPPQFTADGFSEGANNLITIDMISVLPEEQTETLRQIIMKPTLGGMMIFFGFFTASAVVATILDEERQNTLQRLFMAPFSRRKVIAGKFLATFLVLVIQFSLLLLISRLLFGLRWGPFWLQAAFTLLTAAISSAFGIFMLSFLKDAKTAGMIYSGVNTAVGMIAISSTFAGRTDVLPFSLFTPHAWPLRMIYQMQNGFSQSMLLTMAGILLWSIALFSVGMWNFGRRYLKET